MSPIVEDFQRYIQGHWSTIIREQGNPGKNQKDAFCRARSLYLNILKKEHPFIIIGSGVRNESELTANIRFLTSTCLQENKKNVFKAQGLALSILGENPWSVLINDIFMLGAIHRVCEVHLALTKGKMPSIENLWDEQKRTLKPLGRELAVLVVCNFQRAKVPKSLGIVFVPDEKKDHSSLTLSELREKIAHIKVNEIEKILLKKKNASNVT